MTAASNSEARKRRTEAQGHAQEIPVEAVEAAVLVMGPYLAYRDDDFPTDAARATLTAALPFLVADRDAEIDRLRERLAGMGRVVTEADAAHLAAVRARDRLAEGVRALYDDLRVRGDVLDMGMVRYLRGLLDAHDATKPAESLERDDDAETKVDVRCSGRLGTRPSWMGVDQWDGGCRCILTSPHEGDCQCEHTAPATVEGGSE